MLLGRSADSAFVYLTFICLYPFIRCLKKSFTYGHMLLKSVQYFAYSLFYACAIHLWNKEYMSPCLFVHNAIWTFSAFDKFSKQKKE